MSRTRCRPSRLEFIRQRDKLLAAVVGVNADVLGLNEIENTTGVDALTDPQGIVPGVNGILGAGTYAAIETGVIGTDAIRVGLIYKPAKVTPVGAFKVLTSAVDPRFIDTRSRPALAQTFEENATGARFTVIVNHLKSKGSACTDIGDPDVGDGQGNCNVTRTNAAKALVDWAASDPTGSGDPDFLIIGDLNSYAMEDPIDSIKAGPDDTAGTADDYTNLVAQFLGPFAYSYTFDGMAGYLDHALSNASLTSQVAGVTEWHINSDEADVLDYDTSFKPAAQEALYEPKAYRTSDHDPILVGLDPTTSYADLRRLTLKYVDDADVAAGLIDKLLAAERAEERGNERAKQAAIRAYVNQLHAQAGKGADPGGGRASHRSRRGALGMTKQGRGMRMRKFTIAAVLIAALLAALGVLSGGAAGKTNAGAAKPSGTTNIQLVTISDWHGQLPSMVDIDFVAGGNQAGAGAPVLKGYIDQARAANPNTLVVLAGDSWGATPPHSAFFNDTPAVTAMNMMGVDADTFGNHNFDRGISHLQSQIDLAEFPFVAANLKGLEENLNGVTKRQLFTVDGVRVA